MLVPRSFQSRIIWKIAKQGQDSSGTICKQEYGFGFLVWLGGQEGVVARGVQIEDELDAGRFSQAEALRADRHASIRADFESCAQAPDIRPPRAALGRPDRRPVFFFGLIPGSLRGLAQLPMDFVRIVMRLLPVNMRIGVAILQIFLLAKFAGGQPSQNRCSRSILPLARGVGA